jgi:hypothetical protein
MNCVPAASAERRINLYISEHHLQTAPYSQCGLLGCICDEGVRVSEGLVAESIRDEIIRSSYASLDRKLGYFISAAKALEEKSPDSHLEVFLCNDGAIKGRCIEVWLCS